ncbi:ATP-grasp domain-containing protein [Antribacter gilvus]|uniref:ATP-grasp domain-containing protein n=1 Tax=Antribacter gilvus TaxID=2304675 RepID=UPI000F76776E|nr:hypothetical protein [Antribacter gilvus]
MHVLVLQRPGSTARPDVWLAEAAPGVRVTLVTGRQTVRPDSDLAPGTRRVVLDGYDDGRSFEALADLCRRDTPDRIVANSEDDVLRAAELRTTFGVPGQPSDVAVLFRDKIRMRALYRDPLVPPPGARGLRCAGDLLDAVRELGPVVVKPRSGAGSVGVRILADRGTCLRALADEPALVRAVGSGALMAEEYLPGDVLHVDALVREDRVVLASASRYTTPPHTFVTHNLGSVMLDETSTAYRTTTAAVRRLVAGLPRGHGVHVVHAEFYRLADGSFRAGEVACRVGGALVRDAVRHTYGVDLSRAASLLAVDAMDLPERGVLPRRAGPTGWLLWNGGPRVGFREPLPEWVVRYDRPDEASRTPSSSVDARAAVLVEGEDEAEVESRLSDAVRPHETFADHNRGEIHAARP